MNSDTTLIAGALVKHGRDDRSFVLVDPIANGRQGFHELSDVPINSGGHPSHPPTSKKKKKEKRRRRAIEIKVWDVNGGKLARQNGSFSGSIVCPV